MEDSHGQPSASRNNTPLNMGGTMAREADAHPMLPPDTRRDPTGALIYSPAMQLPAPNDERGILRFLGLDDAMIALIIEQLSTLDGGRPPPVGIVGGGPGGTNFFFSFPLAEKLRDLYLTRSSSRDPSPVSNTSPNSTHHSGGISQGLRPEFAVACGLHEVDPRLRGPPGGERFFQFWSKSSRDDAGGVVSRNTALLVNLWRQKLAAEQSPTAQQLGDR